MKVRHTDHRCCMLRPVAGYKYWKVSNYGATTARPSVSELKVYADIWCTEPLPLPTHTYGLEATSQSNWDTARVSFVRDGESSTAWSPLCTACANKAASIQINWKSKRSVKCVKADGLEGALGVVLEYSTNR